MNGIALQVGDEYLDLEGAKVRLRIQSPIFQPEFIRQSYTYPFTLPDTPKNMRLFGHAERLANVSGVRVLSVNVYLGGLFWKSGDLKLRRFVKGYDCDLLIPPQSAVALLGDTNLQDIDMGVFTMQPAGDDDFAGLDDLLSAFIGDITDTDFVLAPVKNTNPLGGGHVWGLSESSYAASSIPDPLEEGYINHYDPDTTYAEGSYAWLVHWQSLTDEDFIFQFFSPYPYLLKVLRAVAAHASLTAVGQVLTEPEFKRMVVVGNLLHVVGIQRLPGSGLIDITPGWYDELRLAGALPNMSCLAFLTSLQKRFNGSFIFSAGELRFVTLKEVLEAQASDDLTELAVPEHIVEFPEVRGYKLGEVEDKLDELGSDRDDQLGIPYQHTVSSAIDLAGLTPDDGDNALVENEGSLYTYSLGNGQGWAYRGPYLVPVSVGDGAQALDVGVALTRMYSGTDAVQGARQWMVPEVRMRMSDHDIDVNAIGRNDTEVLRLLFYRGLQRDGDSNTYPLLTNGTKDYAGNDITGAEWAERIEGENGIHELWYRTPQEVLGQGRPVQRYVRLPLASITRFDFTRKVNLDSINFLVEAIDVEFTESSIGVPRLDLVKV